jgi:hypothetical protein
VHMAPPNKQKRHLRQLLHSKKQRMVTELADLELRENIVIDDEDFDLDGMLSDPDLVQRRLEEIIKWNPAADHVMRAPYTGNSRATKYRKLNAKEQRHRSVADCPKIHTFFTRTPSADLLVVCHMQFVNT